MRGWTVVVGRAHCKMEATFSETAKLSLRTLAHTMTLRACSLCTRYLTRHAPSHTPLREAPQFLVIYVLANIHANLEELTQPNHDPIFAS